ncbi:MAG: hypothetical protein HYV04_14370 [Deltaproteobacteria bacterium]|nr:hypothetical protein [Deltaproteobacteria bacterium]
MKKRLVVNKGAVVAIALLGSVALGFPSLGPKGAAQAGEGTGAKSPLAIGDKFDVDDLIERVRNSSAIGVFTKLSLRSQVEGLVEDLRRFHEVGRNDPPLRRLHKRFNLLMMKLMSLLQDRDPKLSSDIYQAREALWSKLADREEFRK